MQIVAKSPGNSRSVTGKVRGSAAVVFATIEKTPTLT